MATAHSSTAPEEDIRKTIARAVRRQRLALAWEALWPRLAPLLGLAGLFLLASLLGLWTAIPDWLRFALLAIFAAAALFSIWRLAAIRPPSVAEAFARLERDGTQAHRPATAILDRLASPTDDPATRAIWAAHRARLLREFEPPAVRLPEPRLAARDPFALRFLLLLLLAVALIAAGGNLGGVADAFRGPGANALPASVRVDAWASPPAYTGRPTLFLTGELGAEPGEAFTVPAGTELVIRVAGENTSDVRVTRTGADGETEPLESTPSENGPLAYHHTLAADATIEVKGLPGDDRRWLFAVTPDLPPTVAFTALPRSTAAGALELGYSLADDYGVTAARAAFSLTDPALAPDPLFDPPDFALPLPRSGALAIEGSVVRDLQADPYAGLRVELALVAEDAIGQTSGSETLPLLLPARSFADPVAADLVEQRRILALDAGAADNVAATLDAIGAAFEADGGDLGTYLALRSAYHRLMLADTDDGLRGVVDYLWQLAIGIEGDELADAAAALQAATDALREALANGADDAEIAERSDALREAMQDYLQQFANADPGEQQTDNSNTGSENVTGSELQQLLDQIEQQASAGERESAEQLLDRLETMMQNLQAGSDTGASPPAPGEAELRELGELMQEQQELMDQTYSLQQRQNTLPPAPSDAEGFAQQRAELAEQRAAEAAEAETLQSEQQALAQRIDALAQQLQIEGFDPTQLGEVTTTMGEAAERLGGQQPGMAVERQATAIDQLQAAAEGLAREIAGNEPGGGGTPQEGQQARDPLGRPAAGNLSGDEVDVPDEVDRQLAREILDLIRNRLNQPGRPEIEIDYLERLLRFD